MFLGLVGSYLEQANSLSLLQDLSNPDNPRQKLLILLGSNHLLNNSLYRHFSHPDDYIRQITDVPRFNHFLNNNHPERSQKTSYLYSGGPFSGSLITNQAR